MLAGDHVSGVWSRDGEIDRGPFAVIGVVSFGTKYNLDRMVEGAAA
jgi:hypothetical protein